MSWLYSQALVAEYLAGICSDGEPSAPSNGNPTQQAYCAPDKMTKFSRLSRFGMTFKPLTEDHGAALLTSYLADFRARTSAPPAPARASTASAAACGSTWPALSVKYCRDTSSWKTAHCLWDEALPWSSVTLPNCGMTRTGAVLQHPTSERPISGTEYGLWLTPTASAGGPSRKESTNKRGEHSGNPLATAVKWRTPTVQDSKSNGTDSQKNRESPNLNAQVGGPLNPTWIEWLMGWPLGWTDLKPLAMDRFREWQQQHGRS